MYKDRVDAGKQLARALDKFKDTGTVVLALPRGGVVLGAEVARRLQTPLGIILVRKIGHPNYSEYAIGAIAEGEKPIYNKTETILIEKSWLKEAEMSARKLIEKRHDLYFSKDILPLELSGKTVIIVDDGIATGLTMKAAVTSVKNKDPKRIIVAVPVSAQDSVDMVKTLVDGIIVLQDPKYFLGAIGSHYEVFNQVNDDEVRAILVEFSNPKKGESL